jgi:Skp family chaperone for outer membrane proteins
MSRRLVLALGLFASTSAFAEPKLCVADAESAINDTEEGKAAQKKLEGMYATKQADLERRQKALEAEFADYQSRALILSDDARAAAEQALMQKQDELQRAAMQAESDMQNTYAGLLDTLEGKLMAVASSVAASKGCGILMNKAAVLYVGSGVTDITSDIIREYDAKY